MKYTFLNVANFKNGYSIPLFKIFSPEDKRVFYKTYVYGKNNRGKIIAVDSFESDSRSEVCAWRQSKSYESR